MSGASVFPVIVQTFGPEGAKTLMDLSWKTGIPEANEFAAGIVRALGDFYCPQEKPALQPVEMGTRPLRRNALSMDERFLQAERDVQSPERRQKMEEQEDSWRRLYEKLRAGGQGHRQALHLLRGDRAPRDSPQIEELEMMIANSKRRQRAK
jgi:hypothetical protein